MHAVHMRNRLHTHYRKHACCAYAARLPQQPLAAHLPRACRHCRLQCTCSALTASSLAAHLPRACREGQMRLTCDVLAAGYTCSPCAVCLPQLCWQCACGKHTAYTHAVHMRNHLRRNPAANGPQVSPKYPTQVATSLIGHEVS